MVKLSFKKQPRETGLAAIAYPGSQTDIKINKKKCGYIAPPNWKKSSWTVNFAVTGALVEDDYNRGWRWITMKKAFETEPLAREFVREHIDSISEKYVLYYLED